MRKTLELSAVRLSVLTWLFAIVLMDSRTASASTFSPASPQPDLINWVFGPAKVDLGEAAQIDIPEGFRFARGPEAATILRSINNPTPHSVVGLLTPVNGNYMIVFEYTPIGYVKAGSREKIDSEAALAALRVGLARQNSPTATLDWESAPTYDSSRNMVEWSIAVHSGSRRTVNQVVRLLGREGVLDGIAISGQHSSIPLKQVMSSVAFKSGYAYSDYRKGDRVAAHALSDLLATEAPSTSRQASYVWAYVGGGAGLLTAGGFALLLRRRDRLARPVRTMKPAAAPLTNGTAVKQVLKTNGHLNGHTNGHAKPIANKNLNARSLRKRVFDYQRFYSDLMFEVSDRAHGLAPAVVSRNGLSKAVSTEDFNAMTNASLIELQRKLIEEQQRLIREQAKLIEEKTRLIQEKNQVLDKQVELFGNTVF